MFSRKKYKEDKKWNMIEEEQLNKEQITSWTSISQSVIKFEKCRPWVIKDAWKRTEFIFLRTHNWISSLKLSSQSSSYVQTTSTTIIKSLLPHFIDIQKQGWWVKHTFGRLISFRETPHVRTIVLIVSLIK